MNKIILDENISDSNFNSSLPPSQGEGVIFGRGVVFE
jgi:hypothetical protein